MNTPKAAADKDDHGRIIRSVYPRVVASLVRVFGDMDLAEDMTQEAIVKALVSWPKSGLPDSPTAWLVTAGKNRAIDLHRKTRREINNSDQLLTLVDNNEPSDIVQLRGRFDDDLLRLIFTCCHPDLPDDSQAALTLKVILGFSVNEIAQSFLASPAGIEKRLTRAKRHIRERRIPYEVPKGEMLPQRLSGVLDVVYVLFNRGFWSPEAPELYRADVCNNAIRLARMVVRLFRYHPEARSLLSLMLLASARASGRISASGDLVALENQDRTQWNWGRIREGKALLESVFAARQPPGNFQLQAAIASIHSNQDTPTIGDWNHVVALYEKLETINASPVFAINKAVAMGHCGDAAEALALVKSIYDENRLTNYQPLHLCRSFLLEKCGQMNDAIAAKQEAIALAGSPIERRFLQSELDELERAKKTG